MPPKKKPVESGKKTQEKQKQKVIEDKTFGLKNKKGKKQQQFIKQVEKQVKYGGNPSARKLAQMETDKVNKKEDKKKELDELNQLFRPVQDAQKVSAGADPKSVLCAFFKNGQCGKGNKCKFSHDLSLERKSEKRSIYVDSRDDDTMENWDQEQLENVVNQKHGEADKKTPKTEIICKHFLEAIDKGLYGWFWSCPNGEKCIYRHALPPGFVLKRKEKEKLEEDEVSIEEHIEVERANLGDTLTPVTLETFMEWKRRKIQQKREDLEREMKKKKEEFSRGKSVGKISGREMFLFKPELADEDDEEATDDPNLYRREEEVDDMASSVATLTLESLAAAAKAADGTGTCSKTLSAKDRETAHAPTSSSVPDYDNDMANGTCPADENGLDLACAVASPEEAPATTTSDPLDLDGIPVDESLFEEDVDIEDDDLDLND